MEPTRHEDWRSSAPQLTLADLHLISSFVKVESNRHLPAMKTENQRLSLLIYVRDCSCLSIELAQNRHSRSALRAGGICRY